MKVLAVLAALVMPISVFAETVSWSSWELEAFERAESENKLILISVGMEGCVACARMDSVTYTDPAVIRRINRDFVAIEVDAESRPDIGERYSDWAWPATIFLAPDATQVLALRGNRLPRNFIPILDDLTTKHEAGSLEPDPNSPYASPPEPVATDLTRVRDGLRRQLDRSLNERYGGWSDWGIGGEHSGPRLRHLNLRAHLYDHDELRALTLKSAAGFLDTIDPVWGGAYIAAFPADMDLPERWSKLRAIPEKRILVQANAMTAFALGYAHTGDGRFLDGIADVHRYLRDWMTSPTGTFFTNQKSVPKELPQGMTSADYWSLDTDEQRRAFGLPPIDRAVHTDKNGAVISAYVLAYEATGNSDYLSAAERAALTLIDERLTDGGWVLQTVDHEGVDHTSRVHSLVTEEKPFLSSQVQFGVALLDLYRATANERWLQVANQIATATLTALEDRDLGGFFATSRDGTAAVIPPRKPLEANGTAASFFYDLSIYTKDERFLPVAERTLRAVGVPQIIRREGKITGEFALALEKITTAYVEFSIVGDPASPAARALFDAGRAVSEPRKILHFEAPGRYPERAKPAMYICNPDMCSIPIEAPEDVAEQAAQFRGPATSAS